MNYDQPNFTSFQNEPLFLPAHVKWNQLLIFFVAHVHPIISIFSAGHFLSVFVVAFDVTNIVWSALPYRSWWPRAKHSAVIATVHAPFGLERSGQDVTDLLCAHFFECKTLCTSEAIQCYCSLSTCHLPPQLPQGSPTVSHFPGPVGSSRSWSTSQMWGKKTLHS